MESTGPGIPPTPAMSESLYATFHSVGRIEDQIRFADTKAAFVATLHSFLAGPLAGNLGGLRAIVATFDPNAYYLLVLVTAGYCLLFMGSMALVAWAMVPRARGSGGRPSRLFFGRIAAEFGHEPEKFVAMLGDFSEADWREELGRYVVDASIIAANKHRLARWANLLAVPTVLMWVALVLTLMLAGHAGPQP